MRMSRLWIFSSEALILFHKVFFCSLEKVDDICVQFFQNWWLSTYGYGYAPSRDKAVHSLFLYLPSSSLFFDAMDGGRQKTVQILVGERYFSSSFCGWTRPIRPMMTMTKWLYDGVLEIVKLPRWNRLFIIIIIILLHFFTSSLGLSSVICLSVCL